MNFAPDLAEKILAGEKTVTRRMPSDNPRSPWWREKCAFEVGREYAICPGRGKNAVGRMRIKSVRLERLGCIEETFRRAMIRTLSDTGLRLGEVLALRRADFDGEHLHSRGNAHNGRITDGDTETKKHVRTVPVPPGLAQLLRELPKRIDTPMLFPTARGNVWTQRNFYRAVWDPTRLRTGLEITPHECRHSWVTHLRAAGVDDADLARVAGHELGTMISRYTHPLERSDEQIRRVIG